MYFGRLYLDREKDMIVDLYQEGKTLSYVLSTPNHHTGNLITNLAKLCHLPITFDAQGLKIIEGTIPSYIDAYNNEVYILRLGGIKVANIYPDGRCEMKAAIPAISKTLMSQTKHYQLPLAQTIMKSYILSDCKFKTDLHTHMNANLSPDLLIALGIYHQINYPLYYIKKLNLKYTQAQADYLAARRAEAAKKFVDSPLKGKYLDRKIDDNTFINFADFMLHNIENAAYNIPRIRASLAIMKDGQAVFTNIEKVYLYRYVFTKGTPSPERIALTQIDQLPDEDIKNALYQMISDHQSTPYEHNSLFQDKLLWIARAYASYGIDYCEISDTTLVKPQAAQMLAEVHAVMPYIMAETHVMIRFLAGIRRIPLTIVRDDITPNDYLKENLQVLRAVARDPYVAGSDILGEEINDIREVSPVIREIVALAHDEPTFVVRIHAGENDSLRDNVANSIKCVKQALGPDQKMPRMRIGHGLYTSNLHSPKGKQLLADIVANNVTLEFQMTSNVRLNNLSLVASHPLKQYLNASVSCVQGTDGCALYGTSAIDEQLALASLLNLSHDDLLAMRESEERIRAQGRQDFETKMAAFHQACHTTVAAYYENCINLVKATTKTLFIAKESIDASVAFHEQIRDLPAKKMPVIIAGGSFNNDKHKTVMRADYKQLLDALLSQGDPEKMYFVIGHQMTAYEKYLLDHNHGKFLIYAFVPSQITAQTQAKISRLPLYVRVALEPVSMGLYKSIAYEIFKRRTSILLALDGNSAGANIIQEAKNAKKKCRIFVNPHAKMLKEKAQSLSGYITMLDDREDMVGHILSWVKS